jgi:hypothetical protein
MFALESGFIGLGILVLPQFFENSGDDTEEQE